MIKYFLLSILILISSCASVKYDSATDKSNFSKVKNGTSYVVFGKDDFRKRLKITSTEGDSIKGINKNQSVSISKNDIQKVRKNNTGGTASLVYSGAAVGLVVVGLYLFAKSPRTSSN